MILGPVHSLPLFPVVVAAVWTIVLLVGGWFLFGRIEARMADEI
jgi:ABC-type polysaccharide/polyol phosphate export permease